MSRVTQLGSARSLLLTVLGEFVHPNGSPVWTATLVDALQVLGVEEKAARQALTRTAAEGMLSSERHGRRVLWSLTPQGHALLEDGTRRIYGFMRERRPWDGRWLVVSVPIPETQRQLRHRLRTRLSWLGLGSPTSGLWIATDATKSNVVGKVGVALPPTAPGVMEAAAKHEGYIGYYDGGAFGLPVTSKNKEASLLFLQYIGQDSVQGDWAVAAPRITNTSTYDDPKVIEMDKKLGGYYTMLKDDGKLFAGAPPYPFHAQVREATAPIFYRILTGEVSSDDGLDQMAAAAEAELKNLGYRK